MRVTYRPAPGERFLGFGTPAMWAGLTFAFWPAAVWHRSPQWLIALGIWWVSLLVLAAVILGCITLAQRGKS